MADANSPSVRFQVWRAGLPPALRFLLTANLGVFAVSAVFAILAAFGVGAPFTLLTEALALPGDPAKALFRFWTPLTYSFFEPMLGGIWALISFAFAMYWLNWLGRDIEESHGSHRLFGLYLGSAVFGAVVALALATVWGGPPVRPLYAGAWGAVAAVLVYIATLYPNRSIGLFLLGVVPMKWIAVGFLVITLFRPDATLLAAALFGFIAAKAQQNDRDVTAWARPLFERRAKSTSSRKPRASKSVVSVRTAGKPKRAPRGTGNTPPPSLDAVLDKILDKGIESLTAEERRVLEQHSRDA